MRMIEYRGQSRCIATWARLLGYDPKTMRERLKRLPIAEALRPRDGREWESVMGDSG